MADSPISCDKDENKKSIYLKKVVNKSTLRKHHLGITLIKKI